MGNPRMNCVADDLAGPGRSYQRERLNTSKPTSRAGAPLRKPASRTPRRARLNQHIEDCQSPPYGGAAWPLRRAAAVRCPSLWPCQCRGARGVIDKTGDVAGQNVAVIPLVQLRPGGRRSSAPGSATCIPTGRKRHIRVDVGSQLGSTSKRIQGDCRDVRSTGTQKVPERDSTRGVFLRWVTIQNCDRKSLFALHVLMCVPKTPSVLIRERIA